MKHYEEYVVPEHKAKYLIKETCDLCKKELEVRSYDIDECEISHRTGSSYPTGGNATTQFTQLCGNCFDNILIPFLRSHECTIQEEESDW